MDKKIKHSIMKLKKDDILVINVDTDAESEDIVNLLENITAYLEDKGIDNPILCLSENVSLTNISPDALASILGIDVEVVDEDEYETETTGQPRVNTDFTKLFG